MMPIRFARKSLSKWSSASNTRRLRIESLELRQLMTADLSFDINQYASDRLLVQLRSEATLSNIIENVQGIVQANPIGESGWHQLCLSMGTELPSALLQLQQLTDVITVTPDFRVNLSTTPNDPLYASQWPLSASSGRIDASQAWNYGTGSSIIVGVIDTGIDYNHPDLAANIWSNNREIPGNSIDDDGNGYRDDIRGWNFVGNNNNPMDDNGHGTHVAGTIGAVGNNGVGVTGVAWNVKLMPLKFLDSQGSGYLSDAVRAVDYARVNGAKIINASFGGGGFSSAMQTAIQRFQQAGGIFVAAAGNEGVNNAATASYPANYALPNVISVAASTSTNALASFSNYGSNVDIAAPGQNILSTLPGGRYGSLSGTSMAAPHVAGALALLWGQSPSLSATELISLVMSNTDSVLVGKTIHGKLNLGKAATALRSASPDTKDSVAPFVQSAQWNNRLDVIDSVILDFSEEMNIESVANALAVSGPGGPVSVSSIEKSSSDPTQVVVKLSGNNSTAGAYKIDVAATAKDLAGNLLNQDGDNQLGEVQQDRFGSQTQLLPTTQVTSTYLSAQGVTLRDATLFRAGVTRVAIDVSDATTIESLSVELSINHTYASDLRVRLISPTGTAVTLVNRRGGSTDNLRLTLADSANRALAGGSSALTGSYRAEQSLSTFRGQNARGRWTLEIVDLATADSGVLNSAKLHITSTATSRTTSSASHGSAFYAAIWQMMDNLLRRHNSYPRSL
jgi:subtilisin family serine protease/subtilisin-like proprotein convertase family protein